MNLPKYFLVSTILLFISINTVASKPYIPNSGDEVLLLLDKTSTRSTLEKTKVKLEKFKAQPEKLLSILHSTIEYGKLNSEPRYIGFVSSFVDSYLTNNPNDDNFKILKANLLQHDHQFNESLTILNSVLKKQPSNSNARLLRSSILVVQARYTEARQDCLSLLGKVSHLITVSCIAQIDGLTRKTSQTYNALKNSIRNTSSQSKTESSEVRWAQQILAQLALQQGEVAKAEQHLKLGLQQSPNNVSLLNSYADLLINNNDFSKVIRLLKDKSNDFTALLRLTIAEQSNFNSGQQFYKKLFLNRMQKMQATSDLTHQREIAAYYLIVEKNTKTALKYAQLNWSNQKELYDARLLLQCALMDNQPPAAESVINWYIENSISDIRLNQLIKQIAVNS